MPPGRSRATAKRSKATSPSRCCAPTSSPAASRRDRACSEAELADRYRLGKAGVRRALVRLTERDWVQALPRRGYLVKPITLRDIGEIFELRRMIEPAAVGRAAGRCDVNRLRQLDAICGSGFMAGDAASQATFLQAHRQLHLAIVTAGGNARLADVFEPLWDETERLIYHTGLMRSRAADLRHDHARADLRARDRARRRCRRGGGR